MNDFKVDTELLADETRVISVAGELDLHTAGPFERQILEAVHDGSARVVVVLSKCTFFDSTALAILVAANKRLGGQEQRLVLVANDRNIVKIFQITGLDRIFPIVPNQAAALNGGTRG